MKTTASGFQGFIRDKYTDLQPVGDGAANADRIMCSEMTAEWMYRPGVAIDNYATTNEAVTTLLMETFAGPAPHGVFSKSLQETAYKMATAGLGAFPMLDSIELVTPNVHFYTWEASKFGLENPNVVFRATEPQNTASGRIYTKLTRASAKL